MACSHVIFYFFHFNISLHLTPYDHCYIALPSYTTKLFKGVLYTCVSDPSPIPSQIHLIVVVLGLSVLEFC